MSRAARTRATGGGGRWRGWTLVELMVACALGLALSAAAWSAYLSAWTLARSSIARAQLDEDSETALRLLEQHLSLAGFSWPVSAPASGPLVYAVADGLDAVWGCDGGFDDPRMPLPPNTSTPAGGAAAAGPGAPDCARRQGADAIAIRYQIDAAVAYLDADGQPTDCLGRGLLPVGSGRGVASAHYLADQRFYVRDGALHCTGNGGAVWGEPLQPGQPIVEGVVDLQFSYGLAPQGVGGPVSGEPGRQPHQMERRAGPSVQRYVTAAEVSAGGLWHQVAAVQLCVVLASVQDHVRTELHPYLNCQGESVMPADRRIYRVSVRTVPLNQRAHTEGGS